MRAGSRDKRWASCASVATSTHTVDSHLFLAAATGVMNTGGNAAGFLAPVVGLMVDHLGWLATLASGSAFAVTGAALWLLIRIRPAATANGRAIRHSFNTGSLRGR